MCIISYALYNLYKKNKIYENWILDIKTKTEELNHTIREVDSRKIFEDDDDVGVAFDQISELVNSFKKKVTDT
jgi:mevalonate pyrophosphate decarboxylase